MTSRGHRHQKVEILVCITIFINYFCIPKICQLLKETTINDNNNTKVIAKLHQGHFKVKTTKKCENIRFLSNSTKLVVQLTITKTDFEPLLVRHIVHTHFQGIEGSVNPGRGISYPYSPNYTHFLMFI